MFFYHRMLLFWRCLVVSDRLVTGQNPASAIGVAEDIVQLLK
ncbi:Putative intracellular protease/amidase [Nostoc flagelliforme CCNUN1]|uniref:Intracellular protease/amidase n=1 Tax=Nostoc flagelliforme CCNUN1 TaxID=2038116 RepID=A0A2K8T273_9NOSO|nr:Putative intracellular protease/amidase [Nostoc flagelliforme CCNUN1]